MGRTEDPWDRASIFSNEKLEILRAKLQPIAPEKLMVMTFGSYARREASEHSDLDYITVYDEVSLPEEGLDCATKIRDAIKEVVPIDPSQTGAFGGDLLRDDMLSNFGGNKDTNDCITRRILLLLEGEWLTSQTRFEQFRSSIIERYVDTTPNDHQLALFLLNDVIRYWRTMTVDYAYKTDESGKPWAIRNVKLMFSRKLMYAGGLFSIATTANLGRDAKVRRLVDHFSCPVMERLEMICGVEQCSRVRQSYNIFLEAMDNQQTRALLNDLKKEDRENSVYRTIKNEGHNFTRELLSLFEKTFHSTHPIHRAVIF